MLLIACKNLHCPLVFFTQQEIRMNLFLGPVEVSGLPLQIARRGKTVQSLADFLGIEKFHHYYRTGRLAESVLCGL